MNSTRDMESCVSLSSTSETSAPLSQVARRPIPYTDPLRHSRSPAWETNTSNERRRECGIGQKWMDPMSTYTLPLRERERFRQSLQSSMYCKPLMLVEITLLHTQALLPHPRPLCWEKLYRIHRRFHTRCSCYQASIAQEKDSAGWQERSEEAEEDEEKVAQEEDERPHLGKPLPQNPQSTLYTYPPSPLTDPVSTPTSPSQP